MIHSITINWRSRGYNSGYKPESIKCECTNGIHLITVKELEEYLKIKKKQTNALTKILTKRNKILNRSIFCQQCKGSGVFKGTIGTELPCVKCKGIGKI